MTSTLPQRIRPPWLPPLRELLLDDPAWSYRSGLAELPGVARLRVWRAGEAGHFAVVTETGAGLSISTAAPSIWQALLGQYGVPFGLAAHYPAEDSRTELVLPLQQGPGIRWFPLWPVEPGSPHEQLRTAWWDRFGLQVTAG